MSPRSSLGRFLFPRRLKQATIVQPDQNWIQRPRGKPRCVGQGIPMLPLHPAKQQSTSDGNRRGRRHSSSSHALTLPR